VGFGKEGTDKKLTFLLNVCLFIPGLSFISAARMAAVSYRRQHSSGHQRELPFTG
jgi:hypothetical protein